MRTLRILSIIATFSMLISSMPQSSWSASTVTRRNALVAMIETTDTLKQRRDQFSTEMPLIPLFYDVPQTDSLAPTLEALFEQGIVTGQANRLFRPSDPLTREEGISLAARLLVYTDPSSQGILSSYNQTDQWYSSSERVLQSKNIPLPAGSLGSPIATDQFFTLIQRAVGRSEIITSTSSPISIASPSSTSIISSTQPTSQIISTPQSSVIISAPSQNSTSISSTAGGIASIITGGTSGSQGGTIIDAGGGSSTTPSLSSFTITIPKLGIQDLLVTTPADPFTHNGLLEPLKAGVGHLFAEPGAGGKILVYGHSSSYPWDYSQYTKIFRTINQLSEGDSVIITKDGTQYTYSVTYEETVPAKDMSAYQDDGNGEDLILYTCWPPDSISQRYLVHAKPI